MYFNRFYQNKSKIIFLSFFFRNFTLSLHYWIRKCFKKKKFTTSWKSLECWKDIFLNGSTFNGNARLWRKSDEMMPVFNQNIFFCFRMKKVFKNWKPKTNGRMWKSEIWKVQLQFSQFLTSKKNWRFQEKEKSFT